MACSRYSIATDTFVDAGAFMEVLVRAPLQLALVDPDYAQLLAELGMHQVRSISVRLGGHGVGHAAVESRPQPAVCPLRHPARRIVWKGKGSAGRLLGFAAHDSGQGSSLCCGSSRITTRSQGRRANSPHGTGCSKNACKEGFRPGGRHVDAPGPGAPPPPAS